ncbi:PEP-CTERM sorting domain-containing protein [Synoicihabitans lomoniglobus]|uniref:PEP-CTERM sorting domain-containing protein n=1 Tax=Synoicihabitans lomoniglobus TaxID=2909285 RepID=A0AAF0CRD0_9BACT|nr:PEP-CTERM sorting domain-containing protein [Opitutaceae bacterium LMO-M01]WED66665.1 PEP-CTERM sorting domain-containing protein [Opitutaceae bacterium LMO-M01]
MNTRTLTQSLGGVLLLAGLLPLQAQYVLPGGSDNEIGFSGSIADAGVTGYQGDEAGTVGHALNSQNAPSAIAYYYVAGRSDGPAPTSTPYAAAATTATGFTLFQDTLGTQGFSLADVTLHFGPASANYENTWNLGQDRNGLISATGASANGGGLLGVDHEWEGWSGSSVEDRYYSADSSEVFYYLAVNGIRIVDIGYADLFMRVDYGASTSGSDDTIQAYHTVTGVSITEDFFGPEYTIADAFVSEVNANGGGLQVIIDSVQTAVSGTFSYNGNFGSHFAIEGRLAAVELSAVPEPGTYAIWMGMFALTLVGGGRRRRSPLPAATGTVIPR